MRKLNKMKTLVLIGGPMGVGKTSIGNELSKRIKKSVYIEGDLGWKGIPFVLNDTNKRKVLDNIILMIKEAFTSNDVVILGWVMDQQSTIDSISNEFDPKFIQIKSFSIIASPEQITQRLQKDFANGTRKDEGVIERSLARIPLYDKVDSVKIDSTRLTIDEVVLVIINSLNYCVD